LYISSGSEVRAALTVFVLVLTLSILSVLANSVILLPVLLALKHSIGEWNEGSVNGFYFSFNSGICLPLKSTKRLRQKLHLADRFVSLPLHLRYCKVIIIFGTSLKGLGHQIDRAMADMYGYVLA
jgi:hypothetical protein